MWFIWQVLPTWLLGVFCIRFLEFLHSYFYLLEVSYIFNCIGNEIMQGQMPANVGEDEVHDRFPVFQAKTGLLCYIFFDKSIKLYICVCMCVIISLLFGLNLLEDE